MAEEREMRDDESTQAGSGESHPMAGAVGAVAGAATGAVAGAMAGPFGMAVGGAVGAVIGGITGGAAGDGMDELAATPAPHETSASSTTARPGAEPAPDSVAGGRQS